MTEHITVDGTGGYELPGADSGLTYKLDIPPVIGETLAPQFDERYVMQYFGYWAMEQDRMQKFVASAKNLDLKQHSPQALEASDYEISNGVAVYEIVGTITKYGSSFGGGASTVDIRRAMSNMGSSDLVKSIVLKIDSPGGTVLGLQDAADAIKSLAKKKHVTAFIEDLGASAAYWLASQASEVVSNASALVGSIGVYTKIVDVSGLYEKEGAEVYLIKNGEFKGAGTPGIKVSEEEIAEVQKQVDDIAAQFHGAVQEGRSMSAAEVKKVATGKVYNATEALSLGLIDRIESLDSVVGVLSQTGDQRIVAKLNDEGEELMSNEKVSSPVEPKSATIAELKGLKGANDSFVLGAIERGLTLEAAMKEHIDNQATHNAELTVKADELSKKIAKSVSAATVQVPNNAPVGSTAAPEAFSGNAAEDWNAKIAAKIASGLSRQKATCSVAKENPALHEAYIAQANAK